MVGVAHVVGQAQVKETARRDLPVPGPLPLLLQQRLELVSCHRHNRQLVLERQHAHRLRNRDVAQVLIVGQVRAQVTWTNYSQVRNVSPTVFAAATSVGVSCVTTPITPTFRVPESKIV